MSTLRFSQRLLGRPPPPRRREFHTVNYAWERLTSTVHRCRLPFLDVTVGLVWGGDGVLVIDTGTTLAEAAAVDADAQLLTGRRVTHVVLTHKHFDHVLGSSAFSGAVIYSAPEVADYLCAGVDDGRTECDQRQAGDVTQIIAALGPGPPILRSFIIESIRQWGEPMAEPPSDFAYAYDLTLDEARRRTAVLEAIEGDWDPVGCSPGKTAPGTCCTPVWMTTSSASTTSWSAREYSRIGR